jgi:hypothetical protein
MSYPTNVDPFAGYHGTPSASFGSLPPAQHPGTPLVVTAHPTMMPPYGYAPTGQPPAQRVPKRRRKGLIIGGSAAGMATLVVAAILAWFLLGSNGEEDQIRALMGNFNAAVESGDVDAVATYLCADEAATFKGLHIDVPATAPPAPQQHAQVGLSDIQIKGQLASATLTATGKQTTTLYFRKEAEAWKMCAGAQQDFEAAA